MEALLTQILEEPKFKDFTLSSQVYLMNIFMDLDRLSEEERKFIKHRSSVDFVIYHKLDRSLALAIEVDGFEFHENKPDQIKEMKSKNLFSENSVSLWQGSRQMRVARNRKL